MRLPDRTAQPIRTWRNHDRVYMVRHQTICPDRDAMPLAPFGHKVEVGSVVAVREEDFLPSVPPLGDVVRVSRRHHACNTCHGWQITACLAACQLISVWCPSVCAQVRADAFTGEDSRKGK